MEPAGSRAAKQQLQNCSLRLVEQQTRGGGCFHLLVFARLRCNNQPADCLTAKALPGELKAGHLGLFYQSLLFCCFMVPRIFSWCVDTGCSVFYRGLCDEESAPTIPAFVCSKLPRSPVTASSTGSYPGLVVCASVCALGN